MFTFSVLIICFCFKGHWRWCWTSRRHWRCWWTGGL